MQFTIIYRTENFLEQHTLSNSNTHKRRPSDFMNPNKLDDYAIRPRNPQPLVIRTAEYLGKTQIDIMRIEMVPRYDIPP
jgi:hypothetical protein